jgi:hypothetical protein
MNLSCQVKKAATYGGKNHFGDIALRRCLSSTVRCTYAAQA